jgi:hypothetical protein
MGEVWASFSYGGASLSELALKGKGFGKEEMP